MRTIMSQSFDNASILTGGTDSSEMFQDRNEERDKHPSGETPPLPPLGNPKMKADLETHATKLKIGKER